MLAKYSRRRFVVIEKQISKISGGFLTIELRISSYELRVAIHCTSYKLHFGCELRVQSLHKL